MKVLIWSKPSHTNKSEPDKPEAERGDSISNKCSAGSVIVYVNSNYAELRSIREFLNKKRGIEKIESRWFV